MRGQLFHVYLIAYDPGPGWDYFPADPEILITVGLGAAEIVAYIVIVRLFPILGGVHRDPDPVPA